MWRSVIALPTFYESITIRRQNGDFTIYSCQRQYPHSDGVERDRAGPDQVARRSHERQSRKANRQGGGRTETVGTDRGQRVRVAGGGVKTDLYPIRHGARITPKINCHHLWDAAKTALQDRRSLKLGVCQERDLRFLQKSKKEGTYGFHDSL